jgi:hypothetical protein
VLFIDVSRASPRNPRGSFDEKHTFETAGATSGETTRSAQDGMVSSTHG